MTSPSPNQPLRWVRDNHASLWRARTGEGWQYRVIYTGLQYVTTVDGAAIAAGAETHVDAQNVAQADYNARRAARQTQSTVVPTDRLIEAMKAAIDNAYRNLTPPGAITVAVSLEAVAEAVGIDPALLRSETRP